MEDRLATAERKEWVVTKLSKKSKVMRSNAMLAVDCEMVLCEDGTEALMKSMLGFEVRKKGDPHNCLDDACAAMKLVLAKIEHGLDNVIPLVSEDIAATEMAKLLLHRMPVDVFPEDLYRVIPGDFTVELKPSRKAQGDKYSALAIFKNPQEALRAFENVDGSQEKDDSLGKVLGKRVFEGKNSGNTKLKTDQKIEEEIMAEANLCDNHLKETERLKQELREKDCQISMHDKVISECKMTQCDNHLTDIERLKHELREKDFQISMQDKMISDPKKKVGGIKKDNKKKGH